MSNGPRILVIDDSLTARMKLKELLEGEGATVLLAENARQGTKLATEHGPDVVVLDVVLPDGNGIDLCRQWRDNPALNDTLVLLVSGERSGGNDRAAGMRAGALGYVTKPFSDPELLAQVGMLVRLNGTLREMREAKEAADAANRTKSKFLARMSHELRTPLNSIIGFTELMIDDRKDPPNDKRARRLGKVQRNAKNLLMLINDILDISKIEAGRLTLECEEVDVAALIMECVESARPLIKSDQTELRQHLDDAVAGGLRWIGDAGRLRQIVTNLVSNAAKFTESGQIELRARTDGSSLVIEVEDTGVGIAPEHLSSVFDEFEQVDSSSTRRASGTGLGLSICRKLCDLMGGKITVTSTPGTGSCFTVALPVKQIPFVPDDSAQPRRENTVVLYVGNEAMARQVSRTPVTPILQVECVTEFGLAIDRCQRHRPAMAWVDPFWKDALRLLADIKTHRGTASIPLGLLGVSDDRCAFIAFDDCLAPPLGKDTLRRILLGGSDAPKRRRLLVVEGNVQSEYLCDMLAEFPDVELIKAASSGQALDLGTTARFDVVLSDLTDPQAQGLELAHRLRCSSPAAVPQLVAVIPRESTPDHVAAFKAGFSHYLAGHGEPIEHVMMRSLAVVAALAKMRELEEVTA